MQYTHTFTLNTGSPSHTTPRALSLVRLFPWTWTFPFPPLPISYCVAYIVTLSDSNCINTLHLALPKGIQIGPLFPLHLCAFPGHHGPFSLSFHLCLCLHLARSPYPTSAINKSSLLPVNPYVLSHHCLLTLHLECHTVTHACSKLRPFSGQLRLWCHAPLIPKTDCLIELSEVTDSCLNFVLSKIE